MYRTFPFVLGIAFGSSLARCCNGSSTGLVGKLAHPAQFGRIRCSSCVENFLATNGSPCIAAMPAHLVSVGNLWNSMSRARPFWCARCHINAMGDTLGETCPSWQRMTSRRDKQCKSTRKFEMDTVLRLRRMGKFRHPP